MGETTRAGSVAAEDRPERDHKASRESLILRPPESTRQVGGACRVVFDARPRLPRRPFPRASLRRFKGWPEGLRVLLEAGARPSRASGAA